MYMSKKFEVASTSYLVSDIFQNCWFCDDEVSSGNGGANVICSRPEVADDVISDENVDTFLCYNFENLCIEYTILKK